MLPNNVRDALAGESTRPRVTRIGDGALITLRCINGSTRQPVGAVAMGIVEMQPARLVFVDNIVIGERLNAPLPVEHPREDRVRYLQLRAFNRVQTRPVFPGH